MAALSTFIQQLAGLLRGGISVERWPAVGVLPGFQTKDESRTQFHRLVFSMLGLVAAADGRVARKEHERFQKFIRQAFRLPEREELAALHQFYKVSRTKLEFSPLADEYYALFRSSPKFLELMLDGLLFVAHAEAAAGSEALGLIDLAREKFGASAERIERRKADEESATAARLAAREEGTRRGASEDLKCRVRGEDPRNDPYLILGCHREDSDSQIRDRYCKVVFTSHPDRVRAQGANEKAIEVARSEFTRILKAYGQIRRERQLS